MLHHSAPLSADAAEIYRSLADADATVAGGFLVGGQEPRVGPQAVPDGHRHRGAADHGGRGEQRGLGRGPGPDRRAQPPTAALHRPGGDRAGGQPAGSAAGRRVSAVRRRRRCGRRAGCWTRPTSSTRRRRPGWATTTPTPRPCRTPGWVLGVLALAALVWAQRRHYRRTNRVFNRGHAGGQRGLRGGPAVAGGRAHRGPRAPRHLVRARREVDAGAQQRADRGAPGPRRREPDAGGPRFGRQLRDELRGRHERTWPARRTRRARAASWRRRWRWRTTPGGATPVRAAIEQRADLARAGTTRRGPATTAATTRRPSPR